MEEDEVGRRRRRRLRTLFDGVAERYERARQGYPAEVLDHLVATAGLGAGAAVLEVGCGTGQLTGELARRGFAVTAIDIGPSMVAAARRRLGPAQDVRLEVVAFEDLAADDATFDLVVSATAFHWIDPDVKFAKSARLLRPGGWLALLFTGERYDDPFGAALAEMWVAYTDDQTKWAKARGVSPTSIAGGTDAGLFGDPVETTHTERTTLPAEVVVALENTRATSLSWPAPARRRFTDELRHHLCDHPTVPLTQETSLAMAPVAKPPVGA